MISFFIFHTGHTETVPEKRGTLDGVPIEALEIYKNPLHNEVAFQVGYYPFDPYYNAFGFSLGYTHYYSDIWAWEILHGSYVHNFSKSLVAELASLGVQTRDLVERLKLELSTNFVMSHSYGKLVLLQKYLQYIRASILAGPGFIHTSKRNSLTLTIGLRFIGYINDRFSWSIDVRDIMALPFAQSGAQKAFMQHVYFGLGLGVTF